MLRLEKVTKFYGEKLVFKDVTLHIRPAAVTILAGDNGSGKSTLLKIMAGLGVPSSGRLLPAAGLTNIGYLGHQTFIYPEMSALENLRFWARLHKVAHGRAALLALLERMELAQFAEERAGTFSRGMSQRLNLARIFLCAPDLLLLDEPATGLDVNSCRILEKEILAARSRGAAVVWISHTLKADLPLADYVAVLGRRSLLYAGPAEEYAGRCFMPQEEVGRAAASMPECGVVAVDEALRRC